jgi:hypothetical protein
MRISIALLVLMLAIETAFGISQEPRKSPAKIEAKPTAPIIEVFLSSGRALTVPAAPERPANIEAIASVQTYDWIKYSQWKCDVDAYHYCDGSDTFDASAQGWQACRFLYQEASKSPQTPNGSHEAWLHFNPANWYTNDSERPWRFRAYGAAIHARGAFKAFGAGAWIDLRNVGVRLIPAWANNYQRYTAQCEMPLPPH